MLLSSQLSLESLLQVGGVCTGEVAIRRCHSPAHTMLVSSQLSLESLPQVGGVDGQHSQDALAAHGALRGQQQQQRQAGDRDRAGTGEVAETHR